MDKIKTGLGHGQVKIIHRKTIDKNWIIIGVGYALLLFSLILGVFR